MKRSILKRRRSFARIVPEQESIIIRWKEVEKVQLTEIHQEYVVLIVHLIPGTLIIHANIALMIKAREM